MAPAVFVLLPGNPDLARPAGALLVQVHAATEAFPGSCESGSGSDMHCASGLRTEGSGTEHLLRVAVSLGSLCCI